MSFLNLKYVVWEDGFKEGQRILVDTNLIGHALSSGNEVRGHDLGETCVWVAELNVACGIDSDKPSA
jgi:hypothetical protein